jgi:lipoprotein-anchoring transpeptidase ErfK/SrfK
MTSPPSTRLRLVASLGAAALLILTAAAGAGAVRTGGTTGSKAKILYPRNTILTNSLIGHWATVVRRVAAHAQPNNHSKTVTILSDVTGDGTQNLVLILKETDLSSSQTWYQVRLPILPNNSVGWVPRSALGTVTPVRTHIYVNRENQTLVLKKDGRTIFATRVGVGKTAPGWGPTPAGQFYIRDKLTNFHDPFYGPIAFGTSARSAVLTEWPGGGFVGIHGTNEPDLIPGFISHGCIRLANPNILRLAKLITVGTPLTVT